VSAATVDNLYTQYNNKLSVC